MMAEKYTQREKIIARLLEKGFAPVRSKTKKYVAMEHAEFPGQVAFIGPSGALRSGPNVTKSTPYGERARTVIVRRGALALLDVTDRHILRVRAIAQGAL